MSAAHDQSRNDTLVRIADAAERIATSLEEIESRPRRKIAAEVKFEKLLQYWVDKANAFHTKWNPPSETSKQAESPWRD